jgi:tripartite-type tricarboxylate transporter receptor subunit TctC
MRAVLSVLAFAFPLLVQAQSYPDRPVRLVVPFPPGGSVDVVARALTPRLSERMGQQVVIENRSGASGIIGTELVAHARPDGYTLLINTIPFVTNSYLYGKVPYDPFADFLPVSWLCSSPGTLVINPSVPARSVRELLELARAKPGALNYSAAGAGTNPHLAGELFNFLGKVDIVAVQYKGGGPSLLAALGGELGISYPNISEAIPHAKSGKLIVLGVGSVRR